MRKIFVINLDRHPERFAFVKDQFETSGLGARLHRFSAIDARSDGFSALGYTPHSWTDRWELTLSEQAVFESHRALWAQIAEQEPNGALICEDDILVSHRMASVLDTMPLDRFGVIKLDGFSAVRRYGPPQLGADAYRAILEPVPSAACYGLSQAAAQTLLTASETYCDTLDDFLFRRRPGITPVQHFPGVAVQGMCCVATEVPDFIAGSDREGAAGRQAAKGPAAYRLRKEWRRSWTRLRHKAGGDSALQRSGGIIAMPPLVDDLPPYRPQ